MSDKTDSMKEFNKKIEEGRAKFRAIRNRQHWRQTGKRTVMVLKSSGQAIAQRY